MIYISEWLYYGDDERWVAAAAAAGEFSCTQVVTGLSGLNRLTSISAQCSSAALQQYSLCH